MNANVNASTTPPHYDLLIIGAGIAGLAAGRMAQRAGYSMIIIDKGRHVGGRVSTRHRNDFVFNHGAQFITAKTNYFTKALSEAISMGMANHWSIDTGKTVIIGSPVMRSIPNFLAKDLPIQQDRCITQVIRKSNHIMCVDTDNRKLTARYVVCTAPAPQTALLLARDFPALAATAASAVYAPCVTVMLGLADDAQLPRTPLSSAQHDIGWAMRETARPFAAPHLPSLTIQAGANWSTAHFSDPAEKSIEQLVDKYQRATGCSIGKILQAQAHHWLYAKVTTAAATNAIICRDNLAIAGDWLGGSRIENAFTSGIQAFNALTQTAPSIRQ